MNKDAAAIEKSAKEAIEKLPKVSGGQQYISGALSQALEEAQKQAKKMGDSYLSVEHLFFGLTETPEGGVKRLFQEFAIEQGAFMQVLASVRGNRTVNSENPEETYDVLNKYGVDLPPVTGSKSSKPSLTERRTRA